MLLVISSLVLLYIAIAAFYGGYCYESCDFSGEDRVCFAVLSGLMWGPLLLMEAFLLMVKFILRILHLPWKAGRWFFLVTKRRRMEQNIIGPAFAGLFLFLTKKARFDIKFSMWYFHLKKSYRGQVGYNFKRQKMFFNP